MGNAEIFQDLFQDHLFLQKNQLGPGSVQSVQWLRHLPSCSQPSFHYQNHLSPQRNTRCSRENCQSVSEASVNPWNQGALTASNPLAFTLHYIYVVLFGLTYLILFYIVSVEFNFKIQPGIQYFTLKICMNLNICLKNRLYFQ